MSYHSDPPYVHLFCACRSIKYAPFESLCSSPLAIGGTEIEDNQIPKSQKVACGANKKIREKDSERVAKHVPPSSTDPLTETRSAYCSCRLRAAPSNPRTPWHVGSVMAGRHAQVPGSGYVVLLLCGPFYHLVFPKWNIFREVSPHLQQLQGSRFKNSRLYVQDCCTAARSGKCTSVCCFFPPVHPAQPATCRRCLLLARETGSVVETTGQRCANIVPGTAVKPFASTQMPNAKHTTKKVLRKWNIFSL